MKTKLSEVELCRIIKQSNLFPGFQLHEEVGIHSVSCDMVYENGSEVYTIEAKTELNFKVLQQAIRWQPVTTASFVAVPLEACRGWNDSPKKAVCENLGIGIIIVNEYESKASFMYRSNPFEDYGCCEYYGQFYKFPADLDFWKSAFESTIQSDGEAGSKLCKRTTPFSRTIEALKLEATKHPSYTLQQLLTCVPTHYSNVTSAYGAITRLAKSGIIEKFWRDKCEKL